VDFLAPFAMFIFVVADSYVMIATKDPIASIGMLLVT
jgi:hypothetical protein